MSMSATVDRPEQPRPIFDCLPNAIRAAIQCGNFLGDINASQWATTYHCSPEDVERIWRAELTKETNSNANGGDGK